MAEECTPSGTEISTLARKEKRKDIKKKKRKLLRKQNALQEKEEEAARLNDPEEQARIRLKEQEEAAVLEEQIREHEEREKAWLEAAVRRKVEEEERKKIIEESWHNEWREDDEKDEEYDEDGPAEIIWEGDKIIVRKRKVKASEKRTNQLRGSEVDDTSTSNPLPPQSEAFAAYNHVTSDQITEVFAQTPNFGTEQDKSHCPFHFKTGACRFGSRCSRVHFYPDKSCTILVKNMYSGPGLSWEQDEGLENCGMQVLDSDGVLGCGCDVQYLCSFQHTDEEVDHGYEEFYEDVHTEFLKYGELVNFKVCRNGSSHLRGNVYVHYKFLDSAIFAFNSTNGRFFASKQISCEYVGVTRWRIAICGEYLKSKSKTCSRGSTCNFLHCFRNPGGDYEWADWDKPPPKYWNRKMASLFGPSDETRHNLHEEAENHFEDITRRDGEAYNRRSYSRRSSYDDRELGESGSHQVYSGKDGRRKSRLSKKSLSKVGIPLEECSQYARDDSDDHHYSSKRRYQRKGSSDESHGEGRRRMRCKSSRSHDSDEGEPCDGLNIVDHHYTRKKECQTCVSDEELSECMERRTSSKRSQSRLASSPENSRWSDITVYDNHSKRKTGKKHKSPDYDYRKNHWYWNRNHDEEESDELDETTCDYKEEKHRRSKKPVNSNCYGLCKMHEENECQIRRSREKKSWKAKSSYSHCCNIEMREEPGSKKEDLDDFYDEIQRRSRKVENDRKERHRSRSGKKRHTSYKENAIEVPEVALFDGDEISKNCSIDDHEQERDGEYHGLKKSNTEIVDPSIQESKDRKVDNFERKKRRRDHKNTGGKYLRYAAEEKDRSHRRT